MQVCRSLKDPHSGQCVSNALLCVTGSGVSRQEAQQWCLTHAFELVELNPEELPDEDGEFGPHSDSTTGLLGSRI